MKSLKEIVSHNKLVELFLNGNESDAWATIWGEFDYYNKLGLVTYTDFVQNCTVAKKWHYNGQILEEANYKNGVLHGQRKLWYDNGTPWIDENYFNGVRQGLSKSWRLDGKLRSQFKKVTLLTE